MNQMRLNYSLLSSVLLVISVVCRADVMAPTPNGLRDLAEEVPKWLLANHIPHIGALDLQKFVDKAEAIHWEVVPFEGLGDGARRLNAMGYDATSTVYINSLFWPNGDSDPQHVLEVLPMHEVLNLLCFNDHNYEMSLSLNFLYARFYTLMKQHATCQENTSSCRPTDADIQKYVVPQLLDSLNTYAIFFEHPAGDCSDHVYPFNESDLSHNMVVAGNTSLRRRGATSIAPGGDFTELQFKYVQMLLESSYLERFILMAPKLKALVDSGQVQVSILRQLILQMMMIMDVRVDHNPAALPKILVTQENSIVSVVVPSHAWYESSTHDRTLLEEDFLRTYIGLYEDFFMTNIWPKVQHASP